MKYAVLRENRDTTLFKDFESAIKFTDSLPMEEECSLEIIGYAPITLKEALFYADTYTQECEIGALIRENDYTPEEALREIGIEIPFI